ncbi:MAG: FAD-dependent thymidylate synthase, partial [Saccharofermentanales bacterium]
KLIIAGYNIDKSLIDTLDKRTATPEAISAAYARISRSRKQVDELRHEALAEVEKARASNLNIIFEMGHASVAEHAVFNLDLIDVSRYLTEIIQRSRLVSFTEKSQRYVNFGAEYIVPPELDTLPKLKKRYKTYMKALFSEYECSYKLLCHRYQALDPSLKKRDLECRAKEDARYILPLATKTQMGMTINARNIEALLRRLSSTPGAEARELKDLLYSQVSEIAPSLIRYTEPDGFSGTVNPEAVGFSGFLQQELPWMAALDLENKVNVISPPKNADDRILSALIYSQGELGYSETLETVSSLPKIAKEQLWRQLFRDLKSWHKLPRAFETVEFEFEISLSECCWGQFKRHRQCTLIKKAGSPGIAVIPEPIHDIKRDKTWEVLLRDGLKLADSFPSSLSHLRSYLRLNATPVKVYAKMNLREIYHFVRLRSDAHAQWEIRSISDAIAKVAQKHAPNAARMLCGKSDFK